MLKSQEARWIKLQINSTSLTRDNQSKYIREEKKKTEKMQKHYIHGF